MSSASKVSRLGGSPTLQEAEDSSSSGSLVIRHPRRGPPERETDSCILERREKQIEYGKNTLSYDAYISKIPPSLRRSHHPITPRKNLKYSRRQWDGLVKAWKKRLHAFDTENELPLEGKSSSGGNHLKRKRKDWSSSNSRTSSTLSLASSSNNHWEEDEEDSGRSRHLKSSTDQEDQDKTLTAEQTDLDMYETFDNQSELDFPFLPSKEDTLSS